jgi:hypothetical protein
VRIWRQSHHQFPFAGANSLSSTDAEYVQLRRRRHIKSQAVHVVYHQAIWRECRFGGKATITFPCATAYSSSPGSLKRLVCASVRNVCSFGGKVKFGTLCTDERCADIFEALGGTLKAAKKRKVIAYDSELLLQGTHSIQRFDRAFRACFVSSCAFLRTFVQLLAVLEASPYWPALGWTMPPGLSHVSPSCLSMTVRYIMRNPTIV